MMLGKFLPLGLSVLICEVGESPFLLCPAHHPGLLQEEVRSWMTFWRV